MRSVMVLCGVSGAAGKSGQVEENGSCQAELEGCIEALTQAVLLHPLAVTQLMKRQDICLALSVLLENSQLMCFSCVSGIDLVL